jgi:hypothetical protein
MLRRWLLLLRVFQFKTVILCYRIEQLGSQILNGLLDQFCEETPTGCKGQILKGMTCAMKQFWLTSVNASANGRSVIGPMGDGDQSDTFERGGSSIISRFQRRPPPFRVPLKTENLT